MRPVDDTLRHQVLRHRLVNEIRNRGITDENVLGAMANVPRQFFMDESQEANAYEDKPFPIGEGQTISQPYTVAYQTQLLQVQPLCKVLEIGTGSGYQAAVLAEMGAELYTIERQKKLFERNKHFAYLRHFPNIHFFFGDGHEGLPQFAPFDRVLLTAATPELPHELIRQLRVGGKMVLPLGKWREVQRMVRITKLRNGSLEEEAFDRFSFVPMLRGRTE